MKIHLSPFHSDFVKLNALDIVKLLLGFTLGKSILLGRKRYGKDEGIHISLWKGKK
jgi:hypothetical protein